MPDDSPPPEWDDPLIGAFPEHRSDLHTNAGATPDKAGADSDSTSSTPSPEPGKSIGGFRLVALLGTGGMGQVWEAEEVALQRRVALKLVRPDRATDRSLKLFAREARAGGRLAHPGIVPVHAYGEDRGVHWISQELVEDGRTLRDFIDERRNHEVLPEDYYQRCAVLVAQIAEALQSAHDAGVIHRDIKPQNVLLETDDTPRITDFGLARVSGDVELSESGQLIGSFHYMSPEQVRASRSGIDHRTDIFSLGIVLYELLSLRRPFEGDTTHQIADQILNSDPQDLRRLRSRVPSDLAVIAGRALEKDRAARYPTMASLAADLRAHLEHRPITARPPGPLLRASKWTRRNPTVAAAGTVGAIALVVISLLLTQSLDRGTRLETANRDLKQQKELVQDERDNVIAEKDRLNDVVEFQSSMFGELDPEAFGARLRAGALEAYRSALLNQGMSATETESAERAFAETLAVVNFTDVGTDALVEEVLAPAQKDAEQRFSSDQLTEAAINRSIAKAHLRLGKLVAGKELLSRSLHQHVNELGGASRKTLQTRYALGRAEDQLGNADAAEAIYREVIDGARALGGPQDPLAMDALDALGGLLAAQNKFEAARLCLEEALDVRRKTLGEASPETLTTMNNLGYLFVRWGKAEEAFSYYETVLEKRKEDLGEDHPDTLTSFNNMGRCLKDLRRFPEAIDHYRIAAEGRERVAGTNHPATHESFNNLGLLLADTGNPAEGLRFLKRGLDGRMSSLGKDHPQTLTSWHNIGSVLYRNGDYQGAVTHLKRAAEGRRRVFGDSDAITIQSLSDMAFVMSEAGQLPEADAAHREVHEICRDAFGDDARATIDAATKLAKFLAGQRQFEEARDLFEESLEAARSTLPPGDELVVHLILLNALAHEQLEEYDTALALYEESLEGHRALYGRDDRRTLDCHFSLANVLRSLKRSEEAAVHFEELVERSGELMGPETYSHLDAEWHLARSRMDSRNFAAAREDLEQALDRARAGHGDDAPISRRLRDLLVECYEALHLAQPTEGFDTKAEDLKSD